MSFFQTRDGQAIVGESTYESASGDFKPIPANTGLIAAIEGAEWSEYQGDRYINLKWRVLRPDEYAKRILFQKVKVFGTSMCKDKDATSAKAKAMLAAIDTNAGGKLQALSREPTDQDLMTALVGKMMAIKVQVWKMKSNQTGEDMEGNWISAVAPAKGQAAPKPEPKPEPSTTFDDDSIPF